MSGLNGVENVLYECRQRLEQGQPDTALRCLDEAKPQIALAYRELDEARIYQRAQPNVYAIARIAAQLLADGPGELHAVRRAIELWDIAQEELATRFSDGRQ